MAVKNPKLTAVNTLPCIHCHKGGVLYVETTALYQWQNGMTIQDAFPNMSDDDREMLVSGIHPKCWDEMFKEKENL
jgi:hypothetical protein